MKDLIVIVVVAVMLAIARDACSIDGGGGGNSNPGYHGTPWSSPATWTPIPPKPPSLKQAVYWR